MFIEIRINCNLLINYDATSYNEIPLASSFSLPSSPSAKTLASAVSAAEKESMSKATKMFTFTSTDKSHQMTKKIRALEEVTSSGPSLMMNQLLTKERERERERG